MNPRLEDHLIATEPAARDTLNRPLNDLRISVIDQCNFRCTYCMPKEDGRHQYTFLKDFEWLTYSEIERLARLFVRLGVNKLRITGGEPLLRPNLPYLIKQLSTIEGIKDLALTTNGFLLSHYAGTLKNAGLNRITVSLDALNEETFGKINGGKGRLDKVLEGIKACEELGFDSIKINSVIQKNVNDHQIVDLVRYFKGRQPILRFIEYMDVGNCNHWDRSSVVSASEMAERINAHFPIEPADPNYFGEVANRYRFTDGSGEVGFIASITQPFCRSCTRARLSTDGKLYTCLFAHQGADLRALLRVGAPDKRIVEHIRSIWTARGDRYSELRRQHPADASPHSKVEMFQIGG